MKCAELQILAERILDKVMLVLYFLLDLLVNICKILTLRYKQGNLQDKKNHRYRQAGLPLCSVLAVRFSRDIFVMHCASCLLTG